MQRIAVYRGRAEQISKLNDRLYGIILCDFTYQPKGLSLADSKGNHFKIALRDVQPQEPEVLLQRLCSLRQKGFLNYYGMQRFGTQAVSTDRVGVAMMADDWKKAFELVVGGQDEVVTVDEDEDGNDANGDDETTDIDQNQTVVAKQTWVKTRDPQKTLDLFPRSAIAERSALQSYIHQLRHQKQIEKINYVQCLQSIPKNLRMMYVHAYQSRVWNEMASLRHRLYGPSVVVGDLVRTSNVDVTDVANKSDEIKVVVVTDGTLDQFSMTDIVLPLPGHSVVYPTHALFNGYTEYMALDGFCPEKMERKVHETNVPGSYRSVYCIPRDVCGRCVWYDGEPESLIEVGGGDGVGEVGGGDGNGVAGDGKRGEHLGFVVEFSLGSSQYATMALRELLKTETSASYHTVLSQATK
jgi:tRNA pseudouridine13 synthase